jgi:type I restriction enzyme, S subunit
VNWRQTQLDRLIKMVGGGTPSTQIPLFWNGDIPWVSPKDMSVREIYDSEDHITQEAVENSATQIVPAGSILVVVRSGILVRRIPIGIAQRPLAINQDIKALIPDRRFVDSKFLSYFLESKQQVLLTGCVKRGATVHSLQVDKLRKMPIQLPPISEQRRIAEILDQADALRKKRTEADAKAARILPALFYKMFGDPMTNPMKWERKRIDCFAAISYGLSDRLDPSLKTEQGIRIITISNITLDGEIDPTVERYSPVNQEAADKASVQKHDLLFNWRNGSAEHVGKTAIWEENWPGQVLHVSFLLRLRVNTDQADPYYAWVLLKILRAKGFFKGKSRMQINSKFNASELSALELPLPPHQLQSRFAVQVRAFRKSVARAQLGKRTLETLFSSLLHRAFTGDLTAKWREAHMKELLQEMDQQAEVVGRMEMAGKDSP